MNRVACFGGCKGLLARSTLRGELFAPGKPNVSFHNICATRGWHLSSKVGRASGAVYHKHVTEAEIQPRTISFSFAFRRYSTRTPRTMTTVRSTSVSGGGGRQSDLTPG